MGYILFFALIAGAIIYYKNRNAKSIAKTQCAYVLDKMNPFIKSTLECIKRHKEILDNDSKLSNDNFAFLCMYLTCASDQVSDAIGVDGRTRFIIHTLVVRLTGPDLETAKLIARSNMDLLDSAPDCFSQIFEFGKNAYHDYSIHGSNCLESTTEEFITYLKHMASIADELDYAASKHSSNNNATQYQTYKQYYDEYIKCIKRFDPDSVQDGMHWIELTDDEGVKQAYKDGLSPEGLARHVLANTSIVDIR